MFIIPSLSTNFRYDYTHEKSEFIIRMPGSFHERFRRLLNKAISKWISDIQDGSIESNQDTRDIIKSLDYMGSPDIPTRTRYPNAVNKKSPDGEFGHSDCESLCVPLVVEVIWSNNKTSIKDYAVHYLEKTKGTVRTFVGVDMYKFYKNQKKATATVSVWRTTEDDETVSDEQVFHPNTTNTQCRAILV